MKKDPFIKKQSAVRFKLVPNPQGTLSNPNMFIAKFPDQPSNSQQADIYRIFDDDYSYDPDEELIQIDDPNSCTLLDQIQPATNPNVGEAAKYGILVDDRYYDYTQHLVAPSRPASSTEDCSLGTSDLNQLIYDGIKEVVSDPDVLETLEALEDEAYCEANFEDFFLNFHSTDAQASGLRKVKKSQSDPVVDNSIDEFIDIEEYSDESIDLNDEAHFAKYCEEQSEGYDYLSLRDALKQPEFTPSNYSDEDELNGNEFFVPPKKQQEQVKLIQKSNQTFNLKHKPKLIK